MKVLNRKQRNRAKLRVIIIYGFSIILIFSGFHFYKKVYNSDYNSLKAENADRKVLLDKMSDIRNNISAIENYDAELQNAKQQKQIPSIGRIRLSIDSCMQNIDAIISAMVNDDQDEMEKEIYENYKTYQANREIIRFLHDELENCQAGSGGQESDPQVAIIIKDLRNLINQADQAVNGAGKRASKDELNDVKRLVKQMKARIDML